jgi:hypothetical protein
MQRDPRRREWPIAIALSVCIGAAFPRLYRWLDPAPRLGPRGLAAYIAMNTAIVFTMKTWVLPGLRRVAERQQQTRTELRRTLGREPTPEEIFTGARAAAGR